METFSPIEPKTRRADATDETDRIASTSPAEVARGSGAYLISSVPDEGALALSAAPGSSHPAVAQRADATALELARQVICVAPESSASFVLHQFSSSPEHQGALVYVCDEQGRLVGSVHLSKLLSVAPSTLMRDIMGPPPAAVPPKLDQEHVALHALAHQLLEVPVLDASGRFAGVVSAPVLLGILHREHVEDLDRLSGVLRQTNHAAQTLEAPCTRRVRERLPWLLVGLVGSGLAASLMSQFQSSLERDVTIAYFVPGIVYLADAIGTQTEAIAVRGLSFVHSPTSGLFQGELRTGLILGLVLAAFAFPAIWWGFRDPRLALAVSMSLVAASTIATAVGLGFPMLLSRMKLDPALGSGPLATIFQDMLSLIIYFGLISLCY